MLVSFALVFIVGISFKKVFESIEVPGLVGFILAGILVGPFGINVLSDSFLGLSQVLREVALLIIIFRAGLNLDVKKLLENKISVILLSFLPATFEIGATLIIAPLLFKISILDAALLGCVIGAVSPAVIVPNMIRIIEEGYGNDKGIAQMIMSAASVDDIYVITIFLALLNVKTSGASFDMSLIFSVLITIASGIIGGILIGKFYNSVIKKFSLSTEYLFLIVISILFLMNHLEVLLKPYLGFSSLLAIMAFGASIKVKYFLMKPFESSWSIFEVLLFVLIGSQLNLNYLMSFGFTPLIFIGLALIIRSLGVFTALLKSSLNHKERAFVAMSFMPKATVQAAIGPIPLALGLASGELILTVAIVSILVTAPLGAFLINKYFSKLLIKS